MKSFFIFLALFLIQTPRLYAQRSTTLIREDFDWHDSAQREQVAAELRASVGKLRKLLPAPKPSEIGWVENEARETAGIDSPRLEKLHSSREWCQVKIKEFLDSVDTLLEHFSNPRPEPSEMALWMIVSINIYRHMDPFFSEKMQILIREGFLPKKLNGVTDLMVFGDDFTWQFIRTAQYIQEKILLPYLFELQKKTPTDSTNLTNAFPAMPPGVQSKTNSVK